LRPESDAPDVFQLWFNLEDPDGNQVLVRTTSFRVKQQMQKMKANASKK
jgi:flagellar basal body rod protein FlgG